MKTVCLVNMKGGVAKTTLAVNLADALATFHDKRVLLVDLDPQFNATQCIVGGETYVQRREEGEHTIFHVFDDAPPPRSAIENTVRMMGALEGQRVDAIKNVEEVFAVVAKTEFCSGNGRMLQLLRTARGDYVELSLFVHSAERHKSLIEALRVFRQYHAEDFRATASKCERVCRVANTLLCHRLRERLWQMDFRHRDDLLESLHATDRRRLHEVDK